MSQKVRILCLSDTHRNISNAIDIINDQKPDYIFHLGDLESDAEDLQSIFERIRFVYVSGNCDWSSFSAAPGERFFEIGGVKILMCHGHSYNVKQGTEYYLSVARKKGADLALFGHTHTPFCLNYGDVTLLNPGSTSHYGWIEIENGTFTAETVKYEE